MLAVTARYCPINAPDTLGIRAASSCDLGEALANRLAQFALALHRRQGAPFQRLSAVACKVMSCRGTIRSFSLDLAP